MHVTMDVIVDPYDVVRSHGFGDGDMPGADTVSGRLQLGIENMGYELETASTLHNADFITALVKDGRRWEVDEDNLPGCLPADVRYFLDHQDTEDISDWP